MFVILFVLQTILFVFSFIGVIKLHPVKEILTSEAKVGFTEIMKQVYHKLSGKKGYGLYDPQDVIKIKCGPIPFPELSCEDEVTPGVLNPWDVTNGLPALTTSNPVYQTTRKTEATSPHTNATTQAPQQNSYTQKTYVPYSRRLTKYHRGVNRITLKRPIQKTYKYRQFLKGKIRTSSTIPYGWESIATTSSRFPEACNNLAKCEDQFW